ncbi:MAG TPA: hypothetical protein VFM29_06915 [Vicinamibacteria bacterium]|nr:hypothetical protein [Vicinamibacteria bacterium]
MSHRFAFVAPPPLLILWMFLIGSEPPWAALAAMTALAVSLLVAAVLIKRAGLAPMAIVVGAPEAGPTPRVAASCPGREQP